jgi:1,2-diacylglycerol 3-beta-glucosyltransferase
VGDGQRHASFVATVAAGVLAVVWAGADRVLVLVVVSLQVVFVVYFLRHFAFALSALRTTPLDLRAPVVPLAAESWPPVTVIVACKNEEAVLPALAESLLRLDYPAARLQLVLVDDGSTDATGPILEQMASEQPRLHCVRRPASAPSGKSAALNDALDVADGEIVVVFDADHRPAPDVVRRLVGHFRDPRVAAVQGRCQIHNGADSYLARLIALDYMAGYLVNEYGRQALFQLPAYGGANCAVRRSSLRAVGGWNAASVTEDTDLTVRLLLAGHKVRYDVTAVDEEEGVVTLKRFWTQRYRWARGHQQVCRDYRSAVWRSRRLNVFEKAETTMFLFVFHVPVVSCVGLLLVGLAAAGVIERVQPMDLMVVWTLLFLGPLLELGGALIVADADRRDALAVIFFLPLFMVSLALCTKAWVDGCLGRPYRWAKTERAADDRRLLRA